MHFEDEVTVMYQCHFPDLVGCTVIMKERGLEDPCLWEMHTKVSGEDGALDWQLTLR